MGLSDDLPDDALKTAEENEAEQLAAAVLDATEAGEYEAAVEAVGDLLGALYRADDAPFEDTDPLRANPDVHIRDQFTAVGVHASDVDEPGKLALYARDNGISVWAALSDDDVSAGFRIDADGALELANLLREGAARSKAGKAWEYNP